MRIFPVSQHESPHVPPSGRLSRSTGEIGQRLAEMSREIQPAPRPGNHAHLRSNKNGQSESDPFDLLDHGRDRLNHYEGLDDYMGDVRVPFSTQRPAACHLRVRRSRPDYCASRFAVELVGGADASP
jgi:hypothetical protein